MLELYVVVEGLLYMLSKSLCCFWFYFGSVAVEMLAMIEKERRDGLETLTLLR